MPRHPGFGDITSECPGGGEPEAKSTHSEGQVHYEQGADGSEQAWAHVGFRARGLRALVPGSLVSGASPSLR